MTLAGDRVSGVTYDVETVRKDFPILDRTVHDGRRLVYLDSANTSQKPRPVLDAMEEFLSRHNANIHRASHALGEEATEAYESARLKVARFVGSADETEIVFTKNVSEAINLVAYSIGNASAVGAADPRFRVGPGDEIVTTVMEHHSNIVPWQLLCERTGATLRWFDVTEDGRLDLSALDELVNERTKVVALAHQSNMLGTVNPVRLVVERARQVGALVLLDAAQSVPHRNVDVRDLGADFVGFTGHKLCGPTGIGVLWARRELLDTMPPFLGGGEMIETVEMERSTFAPPPHKFEAGTMPITEAVGLGAAVDYLTELDRAAVDAHDQDLTAYALDQLAGVDGLRLFGPADVADRGPVISFEVAGVHPHDVGQVLDAEGVAVRAGHHCARPLHKRFGITASTRASFYLYNTRADVDALVAGLAQVKRFFGTDGA